ncbi:putative bifunctional diguanylate cyclase/phosphodiesterase [Aliagarivorans marinus]|uniref:putative bifunctional diguanylate cyclase/phosphodiesterase n=1 Tax=Aliagarivorans marinus TaxID=561965 RepID=UPI0004161565|nr:EAL domain-containing protein [Aliagarivorans marinus]
MRSLNHFPLLDVANRFVSVRLKLVIGLFVLAITALSLFGYSAATYYQNQEQQLRSSLFNNYFEEFNDQIVKLKDSITYIFEAQVVLSQADSFDALHDYLEQSLPELQWLLPISDACIAQYNKIPTCFQQALLPPDSLTEQVQANSGPSHVIDCRDYCSLWIALPVRTARNQRGIFSFKLDLAEALINVAHRDNIDVAIIDIRPQADKSILIATQTERQSNTWFDNALKQSNTSATSFQVDGEFIETQQFSLASQGNHNQRLLIVKNWSEQHASKLSHYQNLILLLLATGIMSVVTGFLLMKRPLRSLRYHATHLPAILDNRGYRPQPPRSGLLDEFDSLDRISLELADKFGTMQQRIEANTASLERMALIDQLTELPNRTSFRQQLDKSMKQAQETNTDLSLLYIDIDDFKTINDKLGHKFGDQLLKRLATRLVQLCPSDNRAFRLGGDEFTVILIGHNHDSVMAFADNLAQWLARDITIDEVTISVTPSIGVANALQSSYDSDLITQYADLAMYASKRKGRNCVSHFNIELAKHNDLVFTIDSQFKEAMRNDELELFMQPQVSMLEQRIIGFELLLRWRHPEEGLVSPGRFLDVIENGRHIIPLGYWVIDKSITLLEEIEFLGLKDLVIAFNVSGRQFDDKNFANRLIQKFQSAGELSNILELEITESAALTNYQQVQSQLSAIRAAGIRVAFDDFGKGFTSLSYLSKLDCDKIKFDREFGLNAISSSSSQYILLSMQKLMNQLNYDVLVEGVETVEHANWLKFNGFDKVQGYLFGKPVTKDQALEMLARSKQTSSLINEQGYQIELAQQPTASARH